MSDERNRVARAINPEAFEVHDTCLNVWERRKEYALKAADAALAEMGGVRVDREKIARGVWDTLMSDYTFDEARTGEEQATHAEAIKWVFDVADVAASAIEPAPVSVREAALAEALRIAHDHKGITANSNWTSEEIEGYEAGQIDMQRSICAALRAIAEGKE